MGETLHVDYDINEAWTLWAEEGVGGKRADPSSFNNARFTMLAHGHVGLNQATTCSQCPHAVQRAQKGPPVQHQQRGDPPTPARSSTPRTATWVAGADARFDLGKFGYLYGGYSHIGASNSAGGGRALEVLHASGGGEYQLGVVDNYFGPAAALRPIPV